MNGSYIHVCVCFIYFDLNLFSCLFILREREKERTFTHMHTSREGAERERVPSSLCAVSMEPDTGLDIRSRDHDMSQNQELDA